MSSGEVRTSMKGKEILDYAWHATSQEDIGEN